MQAEQRSLTATSEAEAAQQAFIAGAADRATHPAATAPVPRSRVAAPHASRTDALHDAAPMRRGAALARPLPLPLQARAVSAPAASPVAQPAVRMGIAPGAALAKAPPPSRSQHRAQHRRAHGRIAAAAPADPLWRSPRL